jgi:3-deoxy-D-manno-octulosonic-acid transferase
MLRSNCYFLLAQWEWIPNMPYLFNIAYLLLLVLVSPWIVYQRLFRGKYREGFAAKFWGAVPWRNSDRPCIWFHAVSVGEVNLLAVLLKEVAQRRPEVECVISTTTMTGFALGRKKYAEHTVFYCPLDFTWAVRRAMRRIHPSLLVLAELELWPNLVRAAKQHGARVAIVNGRLSENSFRGYRRLRLLLRPSLNWLDCIATQNEEYADRFRMLGMNAARVHVTGSVKFDGAQTDRNNSRTKELRELAGYGARDIIFLAGSTQAPEEQLALAAFQALAPAHPNLRLILVPRHPHRFDEVAGLLDRSGVHWMRRSALELMGKGEWGMGNEQSRVQGSGFRVQDLGGRSQKTGITDHDAVEGQMTNDKGQQKTNDQGYSAIPHSPFPTPHSRSLLAARCQT